MTINNIKLNKGFSIMEIIIYLAIFTTISIVVINSFIIILSSFKTIRSNHDLLDSGSIAMEKISREIRQAKSTDLINTTNTALWLNSTDSSGSDAVVKIIKESNALNLYRSTSTPNLLGNILSSNIIVNSISFDHISTINSEGLKIKIVLQDIRIKTRPTATFYDTVILRGGY